MDGKTIQVLMITALIWLIIPVIVINVGTLFDDQAADPDGLVTWDDVVRSYNGSDQTVQQTTQELTGTAEYNLSNQTFIQKVLSVGIVSFLRTEFSIQPDYKIFNFRSPMGYLIVQIDAFLGWAIEPLFDAITEFRYYLNVLTDDFGFNAGIVNILLIVYSIPIIILVFWGIIQMIQSLPFT